MNTRKKILNLVIQYYKENGNWVTKQKNILSSGFVYDEKELIALVNASLDFWLVYGKCAEEFESKLSRFLNLQFCALTNSGSSANLLAVSALTSPTLKDLRLKPGDEVITTACAFPTTVNPIIQNGLIPVFIDIGLGDYNILVDRIESAISTKTKAIMVSHNLGNPVDMYPILDLVEKYGLWLIEDNCQALGSKYHGQLTGTFGHLSTQSFYPAHHITMGEGGAVLTRNPELHKIILSLRDWGRDCYCNPGQDNTCGKRHKHKIGELPEGYDHKYTYSHIGYNLKATDLQAAVANAQMDKLPDFIQKRKYNFNYLLNYFFPHKPIFTLPRATDNAEPSWFGFPLLCGKGVNRKDLVEYLESEGIATRMMFGGNLTRQPAYKDVKYRVHGDLNNSDLVMGNLFWIGVYPGINQKNLDHITKCFDDYIHCK